MGPRQGAYLGVQAVRTDAVRGDEAWALLRALALEASRGAPTDDGDGLWLDQHGALRRGGPNGAWIVARPDSARGW